MSNGKIFSIVSTILVFAIYWGYNNYHEKKRLKNANTYLTNQINQLEKTISKNNQIIAQREHEKSQDAISIKKLHEQINDAIKNNQCANEYMPDNVINWMRDGKN